MSGIGWIQLAVYRDGDLEPFAEFAVASEGAIPIVGDTILFQHVNTNEVKDPFEIAILRRSHLLRWSTDGGYTQMSVAIYVAPVDKTRTLPEPSQ